jgi:8-oxo-dGTP pyrophosphatase MutT (NUDIX family)
MRPAENERPMSLLRHIELCNDYRADRFLPFRHGADRLGLIRKDNATALRRFPKLFAVTDEDVRFLVDGSFDELSKIIDDVTEQLVSDGVVAKWRHECFVVAPRWGTPAHFKIDRGAVPFFGVKAYGVHLNGYVRHGGALKLWIGRRSTKKAVAPGKLDNLVAGGIGYPHGLFETLIKECGEEASIPAPLAKRSLPVGAVSYRMEVKHGLRDDVLFCYDLDCPKDFTPQIGDDELVGFEQRDAREAIALAAEGDAFKFNVNLVLIDFGLRHGLISPDDPDYLALTAGIHRPLD